MKEELAVLRQLVSELPPLPTRVVGDVATLDMVRGKGTGIGILADPRASVAVWDFSAGAVCPEHKHDQREWIIVIEGELHLCVNDVERKTSHYNVRGRNIVLLPGDYYFVEGGTRHSAESPIATTLIAITVPKSEEFPDAQDRRKEYE